MIQSIADLGSFAVKFAAVDMSMFAKATSLLALPFAHEDLAIILGGYIIANDLMPASVVGLCLYGGIVASDFALYALGAGARHLPWLKRFAIDERVRDIGDTLKRNVFGLVALCRVVPGVVFFAFIACGWARVSLLRFAAASLLMSALYLPLMLYLVTVFGDALDDRLGFWAWPMLFVGIGATGFARKRIFSFHRSTTDAAPVTVPNICPGMPALSAGDRKVATAERIPQALFYFPLVLNWLRLALRHRSLTLPTVANPHILNGGMWGESKSSYFAHVSAEERQWIADYVTVSRGTGSFSLIADVARAERALESAGLDFPLVAKPDIGEHGHGVRRIDSAAQLHEYIAGFPEGAALILQCYVPYAAEAAVLYARLPGEASGRILSLTMRYFPHVIGNGQSTLRELIRTDRRAQWKAGLHLGIDKSHSGLSQAELARVPERGEVVRMALIGNQRAGALYRDGRRHITAAMEARFNAIACSMQEFHCGRFDLRFESLPALMRGEDFQIVEINGIGGEAIDAWDPRLPLTEAYRRLADHQRLLFLIGERNRARGFVPTATGDFAMSLLRELLLIRRYPAST